MQERRGRRFFLKTVSLEQICQSLTSLINEEKSMLKSSLTLQRRNSMRYNQRLCMLYFAEIIFVKNNTTYGLFL